MNLKDFLKRVVYREKATSESYIRYLRKMGVNIGEDCIFYAPSQSPIDIQYPWMISIGNHVRITAGVKILTHDYSWSVFQTQLNAEIKGAQEDYENTDIESFYKKRKAAQLQEAKELARTYVERYGRKPKPEVFHEYFMLFCDDKEIQRNVAFSKKIELCGNAEQSLNYMSSNSPLFNSYEEFINYCLKD